MNFRFPAGCRPQGEARSRGVWGAAAPKESENKSDCPRVGVGVGRGVVSISNWLRPRFRTHGFLHGVISDPG